MGILSALIGWLGYHLGLRTDAASATGSLHAKVKNIADTQIGTSADTRATNSVMGWLSSLVKSVQRGTVSLSNGANLVTILSVNLSKSILLISGDGLDATFAMNAYLSNATTITVNFTTPAAGRNIAWQVIEFY